MRTTPWCWLLGCCYPHGQIRNLSLIQPNSDESLSSIPTPSGPVARPCPSLRPRLSPNPHLLQIRILIEPHLVLGVADEILGPFVRIVEMLEEKHKKANKSQQQEHNAGWGEVGG